MIAEKFVTECITVLINFVDICTKYNFTSGTDAPFLIFIAERILIYNSELPGFYSYQQHIKINKFG